MSQPSALRPMSIRLAVCGYAFNYFSHKIFNSREGKIGFMKDCILQRRQIPFFLRGSRDDERSQKWCGNMGQILQLARQRKRIKGPWRSMPDVKVMLLGRFQLNLTADQTYLVSYQDMLECNQSYELDFSFTSFPMNWDKSANIVAEFKVVLCSIHGFLHS